MSDLPKEKLSFIEQPFTHTDFDFLRPINVKLTCKQDQTKLHISDMELLTIATRAFHLELATVIYPHSHTLTFALFTLPV